MTVKADTVKMQVNKYVHPTQMIPHNLSAAQVEQMLEDKTLEINVRIKDYMKNFDDFLK